MPIKKEITNTECSLWKINKNINPITKRKISSTSPIYKKFEKVCGNSNKTNNDDIYKIVNDFCSSIKKLSNEKRNINDNEIYEKINNLCSYKKEEKKVKFKSSSSISPPKKIDKKEKEIKFKSSSSISPPKKIDKKEKEIKIKSISISSSPPKKKKQIKSPPKKNGNPVLNLFKGLMPVFKKDDKKNDKNDVSSSLSSSNDINDINKKNIKLMQYFKDIRFNNTECLKLTKYKNKYLLSDDVILYRNIGSKSVYGIVYKSKNINPNYKDIPKFISKIQLLTKEAKQELSIFETISNYAINNNCCHFPILYTNSICDTIIRDNNYPELLEKAKGQFKNYSVMLYELANGDYYSFIKQKSYTLSSKIWKNIYEQIFMSIFIYHNLDIYHADTHGGNFLYTKIKPGGCFHYKINDVDYYIENIGYKWMLWDYGISVQLSKMVKNLFFDDYIKIFFIFMKYNETLNNNPLFKEIYSNARAGYLSSNVIIPSDILNIQQKIWEHIGALDIYYKNTFVITNKKTEYDWFKYFIDNNILFSKVPIGHIISTSIIDKSDASKKEYKIKFAKFK
jgi:hypothetical protein